MQERIISEEESERAGRVIRDPDDAINRPIFEVGDELTVKGMSYKVHAIKKSRLILKPVKW